MTTLSKEQIWAADDIEEREVAVPQWKGTVRIRSLSLHQMSEIRAHAVKIVKGKEQVDESLAAAGMLCEGIIEPEIDFADAQRMMRKSQASTGLILTAIREISGLLPEAVEEAEKSADGRSLPVVSVLPGARVEDDAAPVAPGDDVAGVQQVERVLQPRGARA